MRSRVRVLGHPLHPTLVAVPLAAFPLVLVLDIVWLFTDRSGLWSAGWWIVAVGLVTGAAAAIPGAVDLKAVPGSTAARRKGIGHMLVGTALLLLMALALYLRWPLGTVPSPVGTAVAVDALGAAAAAVQGFLGGELVYRHHLGVPTTEEGAEPTRLSDG